MISAPSTAEIAVQGVRDELDDEHGGRNPEDEDPVPGERTGGKERQKKCRREDDRSPDIQVGQPSREDGSRSAVAQDRMRTRSSAP